MLPLFTTARGKPLLGPHSVVTTMFPEVAPTGTTNEMLVALHEVGVRGRPFKLSVLDACIGPKPVPLIVIGVPARAEMALDDPIPGAVTGLSSPVSAAAH